jgi:hypothetical protein
MNLLLILFQTQAQLEFIKKLDYMLSGVALGKGEVGVCPRPHFKIRSHPKNF